MSPFKRGSGSFHRGGSDTRCRAGDVSSRPQDGGDSVTLRFRNHLPALESRGLAGAALTHGDVVVVDAFDTDFVQCEHISSILPARRGQVLHAPARTLESEGSGAAPPLFTVSRSPMQHPEFSARYQSCAVLRSTDSHLAHRGV